MPEIDDKTQWDALDVEQKLNALRMEAIAQRAARRGGRARILFQSALISGLVALVIGRVIEVQGLNKQQERSRVNCIFQQRAIVLTAETYDAQADNILGDNSKKDGDLNEHIRPIRITGTSLEKFRPLLIAQAKSNRARSRAYAALEQNCDEVFPPVHIIFGVG